MARLIKIIYKHQAVLDIRQTQEYIAQTLGNKKAAQKLVASILKAISLLEDVYKRQAHHPAVQL